MVKRGGTRWLWTTGVALGLLVLVAIPRWVAAQEAPLLWARNIKGDTRPIQLTADDAVSWTDAQGKRIFLLKGKVWIEQGDAHFRAAEAVIWVDEADQKKTGIYHLELYGDGGVSLDVGGKTYESPVGMIELNTRGVVNIKTFKNKVLMKETPEDPLFKKAEPAIKQPAPKPQEPTGKPKGAIKQVSNQEEEAPGETAGLVPVQLLVMAESSLEPTSDTEPQPSPVPATAQGDGQNQPPPPPPPQYVAQQGPGVPGPPAFAGTPQPPPAEAIPLPLPGPVLPPDAPQSRVSIRPRYSVPFQLKEFPPAPNGEKASVISQGVIITIVSLVAVKTPDPTATKGTQPPPAPAKDNKVIDLTTKTVEIQADRVVVWTRGDVRDLVNGTQAPPGQPGNGPEFYLSGNVEIYDEIAQKTGKEARLLSCKEAYVDVKRNLAVGLDGDLQIRQPGLPDPIHMVAPKIEQLNDKLFQFDKSEISASKLPYGPGLYVTTGPATLEEKHILKTTIFGTQVFKRDTGEPEYVDQLIFRGTNVLVWLEGVPIFYLPFLQGDARDPLGPLESLGIGYSQVFGFQLTTSWNVYDLIGVDPVPNTRWHVDFDYFSLRGPVVATEFAAHDKDLFGISGVYDTLFRGMVIHDTGVDVLGGNRGQFVTFGIPPTTFPITHPDWRGRVYDEFNWQELPYDLTVQAKLGFISDKNFLDQSYNPEWLNGLDEATYLYVKQQENDWAWTALVEPRIRNWVTETEWLPEVGGHWIGQDFLDAFTYTNRSSAGFGYLEVTHQQPYAYEATDIAHATGRFDFWNEVDLPFQLGAFKLVPYGVFDLTYYTQDLNGNEDLRVLGGGGLRASIPFSRLYPDISSELFNVDGIYHKIVFSGNYSWIHSDRSHYLFPQLDQLNDNESDQALRDIRPQQYALNPANAVMLNTGFFDPQLYALRKLVETSVDTLDSMEEVELDVRQRWQTKRGFPGQEHIIDWMTLDLSLSLFPQPDRDNFSELVNFLQYDWTWNIGDRTTVFSSGWFDPHPGAARVWTFGTQINRPDSSSLYLAYNQIDPLDSKQVLASVSVPFSSKYSISASTSYDFGTNTQINAFTVTRTGTDLVVSLGLTYNSILSNFGFTFEIYPNLFPATKRTPGFGNALGSALGH